MSPTAADDLSTLEAKYRELALSTVASDALFNGQDYPQVLLRGRYDPWADHDNSRPVAGGVSVLEFAHGARPTVTELESPAKLRQYLATDIDQEQRSVCRRRLFLVEGLDVRWVEILGSQLRIHPGVFIAQSTDPGFVDIMDVDGFLHDASTYWVVQVQQLHRFSRGFYDNSGTYMDDMIKPKRLAGRFIPREPRLGFTSHLVSFWSHCHDSSSWDGEAAPQSSDILLFGNRRTFGLTVALAMIIVDPLYRPTKYKPTGKPGLISITGQPNYDIEEDLNLLPRAPRVSSELLSSDPDDWVEPSKLASMSMKNQLIHAYTRPNRLGYDNLSSVSQCCQGVVFSMWNMTTRMLEDRYMSLWDSDLFRWHFDNDTTWQLQEYQRFSGQQLIARRIKKDILDVCRKLDVDMEAVGSKGRSWKWLLERLDILHEQLSDMMNMSTQRASVQESISSNEQSLLANHQARSVGRLTAFAAILVPFTIVSGIFSMGGEYAVGEQRFWVFWAAALPASCVTVLYLFYIMRISSLMRTWRERTLSWCRRFRGAATARTARKKSKSEC